MSEIDWDSPEIAASYDNNCDHQFMKGQMLVEMMGITEGDYVLDLGCGTGRLARTVFDRDIRIFDWYRSIIVSSCNRKEPV